MGFRGAIPLIGDWRGTGLDRTGYYDPRYGTFHRRNRASKGRANAIVRFGPANMIPLAGLWFGI